jgi:AcrR family transcriptional regulator
LRDPAATRQKLQEAALSLFVQKGIAETSVSDLARTASVAEGTLYRHYVSKDDLVADLFVTNFEEFGQRISALQSKHKTFREKLKAVVAEVYRFFDDDPTLFRFLLLVQHQALPSVKDGKHNPVSIVQAMVEEAVDTHAITINDTALATAMIFGLILQPATAIVYGRMEPPLSPHADAITSACWRAINP